MKTILTVIGARPQFIKAAVVSRAILARGTLRERIVHTGQHFDANMSDVFFDQMGIPQPAHNLKIAGGSHGDMTGRMLGALEAAMIEEKPDIVMVYGDTNSTIAGALAAAKLQVPVAHVEAGLRSFNRAMPEEINRVLTDHCSELLLTPTDTATGNLVAEGLPAEKIVQTGDVMFDAAIQFGEVAVQQGIRLDAWGVAPKGYVLATVHRQENTDDPARLRAIFEGLSEVAKTIPVVLPLHPRTRNRLDDQGLSDAASALTLVAPLGFLEMLTLERHAAVIATDSGGVQKEAFFNRVPCVTLRDETEWTELVAAGWNRLTPPLGAAEVAEAVTSAIGTVGQDIAPYGNADASERIVDALETLSPSPSG